VNRRNSGFSCSRWLWPVVATTAVDPEAAREVALQYIDSDVGTTGPFNKNRTKDLDVLSAEDRAKALTLLDRGAVGFVAFGRGDRGRSGCPRADRAGVGEEGGRRFSGPCRPRPTKPIAGG